MMNTSALSTLLFPLLLLTSLQVQGQTAGEDRSFRHLRELIVDEEAISLYYNPETSTVFNEDCATFLSNYPAYADTEIDEETGGIMLLATTLNGQEYLVGLALIPDPYFYFVKRGSSNLSNFDIEANNLYLPGNAFLYADGFFNQKFNKRWKYKLEGDTIKEITQPYDYVGLVSKTLIPLTLYQERSLTTPLAQLPKDYEVEVLLADKQTKDLYLVRTKFGLVGWTSIRAPQYHSTDVEGIRYMGD